MMNLSLFQKIIKDFQIRLLPPLTLCDLKLSFIKDRSLTIVGVRRSGKTYRTFQLLQDLEQQGIQFSDPGVRDPELRGISKTASFLGIQDVYVITFNEEEIIDLAGIKVNVLPAWKSPNSPDNHIEES